MTVEDIILKAGGLKESAATGFVEIVRRKKNIGLDNPDLVNSQIAEIIRFSIAKNLSLDKSASTFELLPFDEVFVRSSPNYETQQFVTVKGQVLFPGVYGIEKKDQRLSEIISRAGGLNKQAYPEGARLIRKIILSDTEKSRKKEQLEEISDNYDNTTIKNDPLLNKGFETIGIDLVQAIENPLGENDLILNDGDYVEIPKEPQTVKISGEVLYPNSVKYLNSKNFSDYISEAGGYTSNSVRKRAYVLYSNGSVKRVKSFLFMRVNPKIEKGAEIIIPAKSKSVNYSQQIISLVSVLTGTVTSIIGIITLIKATAN
jgi:protein involved in polysaccharide export with SLBB domain